MIPTETIGWESVTEEMHEKGYAIIPKFISNDQCIELINEYNNPKLTEKLW